MNLKGLVTFSVRLEGRGVAKLTRGQVGNACRKGTCQSNEVFNGIVSEGKPDDLMLMLPVRWGKSRNSDDLSEEPEKYNGGKREFSIRSC